MSTVREVEDKYDVSEGFEVPDFGDLPDVASVRLREAEELEALYFDTSDLRLARRRITLRRRTGGADAGWHLKLPAGTDRQEVQRPLGRAQHVPRELGQLVFAHTRGMKLAPVAQLRTTRTTRELIDEHGQVVASVMDDEVRADLLAEPGSLGEASAWREIEVESGSDDRSLLKDIGRRLRDSGARRSSRPSKLATVLAVRLAALPADVSPFKGPMTARQPAGEVVRCYLMEQLERLLMCDVRVRLAENEGIHDMRVATRRLRSALETFEPVLEDSRSADLEQRLRELAGTLGVVRDAEVLLERLLVRLNSLPPELVLGPVPDRVQQTLEGDMAEGRTILMQALSSAAYGSLIDDLMDFVATKRSSEGLGSRPAKEVLPALVARRYRKLARRARHAAETTGAEHTVALHQTRKAAKQVRYAAETLEGGFGPAATALAKQAQALQEVLGEHQDSVVAGERLKALAIAANAATGESAFTFGVLAGLEQASGAAARGTFDHVWSEASRRRYRRWLT